MEPKVDAEATGHVVAHAVLQPAGASEQDERQKGEGEVESSSAKKRRRTFVPEAAKVWLMPWATRLEEKGWSRLECIKTAQELCPEVFGTLSLNSTYKWGGGKSTEAQMEKDKKDVRQSCRLRCVRCWPLWPRAFGTKGCH